MPIKIIAHQGDKTLDTLGWIRWAETDYLAARLLLLTDGLLVQGAALANTTIEKFLKALFSHSKLPTPRGHDVEKLYEDLKSEVPGCKVDLNVEFLRWITKSYSLRYPDDLEEGFNLSINQVKLLSQLDRSVQEIGIHLDIDLRGTKQRQVLDLKRENNDPRYFDRNVAVFPTFAENRFADQSECYEITVHQQMLIEAFYRTVKTPDDLSFDKVGLAVDPTNRTQYRIAYTAIP
jgi:HEPN domain-containing protein